MTQKELLYIEDSLEHFLDLSETCNNYSKEVADQDLKELLSELSSDYRKQFEDIFKLIN